MARLPRLVLAGHRHLVLLRALDGVAPFADEFDRQGFIDALREAAAAERVQVHAFGLHEHEARLLLTPTAAPGLSRCVQAIGRRYVSAYNRRHGRSGTLWSGRFGCALVEPGGPVLDAMVWVEAGAVAGSAPHHLGERRDMSLGEPAEYWALGNTPFERELAWRERLDAGLPAPVQAGLRRAAAGGWVHGTPVFVQALAGQVAVSRPVRPRAPGRPPRSATPV